MSDFSVLQCLGYAERSSPYGQLFRVIYQCTGPKELRKLEPLIDRTYLQHVSAEVEESSWLDLSIRPQGQGNNNSAARSQISSSKAEKRRTEVEGENVKWTERVKVRDLRTHLNNNRWSVFTRLGGAGHNNNRKKWRSRNRKN